MSDEKVAVYIGERSFPAQLVSLDPVSPGDRRAAVTVRELDLAAQGLDLADRVRILATEGTDAGQELFSGYIVEMQLEALGTWTLRASRLAHWRERVAGALSYGANTKLDIGWSIFRSIGVPAAEIPIKGWKPPEETFRIAVAIEGAEPTGHLSAGPVLITTDRTLVQPFGGFDDPELRGEFDRTGVWGIVDVVERRMHEAEVRGLDAIQRTVSRLAIASRFSLARGPSGQLRPFRRTQSLERLRVLRVVGVLGGTTGRRWLRGYAYTEVPAPFVGTVLTGLEAALAVEDDQVDEAVYAWRRATMTDDSTTAVVALAEACEFLVNGVEIPPMFSDQERAHLRRVATAGFDGPKRDRVMNLMNDLNSPSFRTRLLASLALDEVPYDGAEVKRLTDLYVVRSKILHGSERRIPSDDDLRRVTAFVNRMIVFRLHRLSSKTT